MNREIWTIGHSNRSFDELLALLQDAGIEYVADVRRFNASRRHPHFGCDEFESALARSGVHYRHFPELGGRRGRRQANSPNTAWRVESFNAYADHMTSSEFEVALGALEAIAQDRRVAVLCSEAVPWRCHRRLISDALVVRGWTVHDIIGRGSIKEHHLTDFARVENGRITYPSEIPHDRAS
jgi:uncharacterized protein (DUF488 family)